MLHKLLLSAFAALLMAGFALAEEVKIMGKVKSVDKEKNSITITVDDKDQTFTVPKDAKLVEMKGGKKKSEMDIKHGLGGLKEGNSVTVTVDRKTEKVEDKDVTTDTVTKITLEGAPRKKKDAGKDK